MVDIVFTFRKMSTKADQAHIGKERAELSAVMDKVVELRTKL
jgi:hypothetical protein